MNIQLNKDQKKILIESSDDLARIMRQILMRENKLSRGREHLWTIGLDAEFKLLFVELIAFGIPAKDQVEPTEIYKFPITKDAKYLYLCHNRKTDDMSAQEDDKALTDRMIQVGRIIGITVFDHIVINAKAEDHLSYNAIGLMDELRQSLVWVPAYEQIERIQKMQKEQIAKKMKADNVPIDQIIKFTGLSAEEIEKL